MLKILQQSYVKWMVDDEVVVVAVDSWQLAAVDQPEDAFIV